MDQISDEFSEFSDKKSLKREPTRKKVSNPMIKYLGQKFINQNRGGIMTQKQRQRIREEEIAQYQQMIAKIKKKAHQRLESIHTIDEEGYDVASCMSGRQLVENQSIRNSTNYDQKNTFNIESPLKRTKQDETIGPQPQSADREYQLPEVPRKSSMELFETKKVEPKLSSDRFLTPHQAMNQLREQKQNQQVQTRQQQQFEDKVNSLLASVGVKPEPRRSSSVPQSFAGLQPEPIQKATITRNSSVDSDKNENKMTRERILASIMKQKELEKELQKLMNKETENKQSPNTTVNTTANTTFLEPPLPTEIQEQPTPIRQNEYLPPAIKDRATIKNERELSLEMQTTSVTSHSVQDWYPQHEYIPIANGKNGMPARKNEYMPQQLERNDQYQKPLYQKPMQDHKEQLKAQRLKEQAQIVQRQLEQFQSLQPIGQKPFVVPVAANPHHSMDLSRLNMSQNVNTSMNSISTSMTNEADCPPKISYTGQDYKSPVYGSNAMGRQGAPSPRNHSFGNPPSINQSFCGVTQHRDTIQSVPPHMNRSFAVSPSPRNLSFAAGPPTQAHQMQFTPAPPQVICSICKGPNFVETKLDCGHKFHLKCIQNHMVNLMKVNVNPNCPLCKANINRNHTDPIFDICFGRVKNDRKIFSYYSNLNGQAQRQ